MTYCEAPRGESQARHPGCRSVGSAGWSIGRPPTMVFSAFDKRGMWRMTTRVDFDFYFFIGSTYTYLTVNRIGDMAKAAGIGVRWKPFFLRTILAESNYTPFVGKPAKTAYMWRDIERRALSQGTPWYGAAPYPVDPEGLANHVAFLASREGWCENFVAEIYRRWFTLHEVPGDPVMLAAALDDLGQDATAVIARARSDDVREGMVAATDEARACGVFGSPTFVVDGELFWGDDRLEDALAWATGTHRGLRNSPTG